MDLNITIKPTKKQEVAYGYLFDDTTRIVGFGAAAGSGKTWMGCEWVLLTCLRYPGARLFIGRRELKRLMNSTYITFMKVCQHHKIPPEMWRLDGKYNVIKFQNGSSIDLLDVARQPTDPEYQRFGSLEYTGGFGDEAGEWDFDAFDILKSRIGRNNIINDVEVIPKFLLTFNPTNNWLRRIFYEPYKKGELPPEVKFVPALWSDNPYTAKSYKEQLDSISNVQNRARLRDGAWDYEDSIDQLTTPESLSDMFSNAVDPSPFRYMTVDVARKGTDKTVFSYWVGWKLLQIEKVAAQTLDVTEQKIRMESESRMIPFSNILVDSDGLGAGVQDHLRGIKGFMAATSPIATDSHIREILRRTSTFDPKVGQAFRNLKAQCGWKLAEIINDRKIRIEATEFREEIIQDLGATLKEYKAEMDGKHQLVPKDQVRDVLGRSPDVGDTILMRAYFELLPQQFQPTRTLSKQKSILDQNERSNIMGFAD